MLPAGRPTEQTIAEIAALAAAGDIVIDGGNTFYKDDIRRAKTLAERQVHYVDVGTSGGVWGLERGYCLMIGGDDADRAHARPDLRDARARLRQRSRARPGARAPTTAPSAAISMPGRRAPAISSRWSTTASNTA